jgi:hypothetical protein
MRPFPENFELESFFECEPEVLDKDVPWAYNELLFNIEAENGKLQVKMVTGYELMDVIWKQGEYIVLNLKLKGVQSLQIKDEKKYDTLVASFRSQDVDDLIIKIRPVISVTWGYDDQP